MKNFKGALIAVAVLLALGTYIHYFEKGPAKGADAEQGEKLFQKAVADVQSIVLESPQEAGSKPLSLSMDPQGTWRIVSPETLGADEMAVRNLLTSVSECRIQTEIKDPKNLADYGLAQPRAKGALYLKDGSAFTLEVGDKNVNGSASYLKTSGRKAVVLVPNDTVDHLTKKLFDLRDKKILSVSEPTAQRVRIKRGAYRLTMEKGQDGKWTLLEPTRAPAAPELVRQFLSTVDSTRAVEFPSDAPKSLAPYGLTAPRAVLEVWEAGSKEPKTLLLGSTRKGEQKMFVKVGGRPNVYLVNPESVRVLETKMPGDFRSKDLMQFGADQVTQLVLRKGSKTFTYKKDAAGTWTSPERPLAASEAPGILAPLATTFVLEYVGPGVASGLQDPVLTAEVTLADGKKRTYRYGRRVGEDKVYLASDQGPDTLVVASYILTQLEALFNAPAQSAVPAKKK